MTDTDTTKPKATTVKPPPPPKVDKPKATTGSKRPQGRPIALENQLTEMFLMVGMVVASFDATDGEIVAANAPALGKAWANLAKEDKRVKAAIERLMTGSAWGQVIFTTGGMAFAIARNHGFMDGGELPDEGLEPTPDKFAPHTRPAAAGDPPAP